MAFWSSKSPELEALQEIAGQLKIHNHLYRLALEQTGIHLYTGTEEGEVLTTDLEAIQKKEFADELRRLYGLKPDHSLEPLAPDGTSWATYLRAQAEAGQAQKAPTDPGGSFFDSGGSWGLGFGPEGSESIEPGVAPPGYDQFNPPSAFERQRDSAEPEGESRPDSSESPERGDEEQREPASKETGT
jgi:hypothetical protein